MIRTIAIITNIFYGFDKIVILVLFSWYLYRRQAIVFYKDNALILTIELTFLLLKVVYNGKNIRLYYKDLFSTKSNTIMCKLSSSSCFCELREFL